MVILATLIVTQRSSGVYCYSSRRVFGFGPSTAIFHRLYQTQLGCCYPAESPTAVVHTDEYISNEGILPINIAAHVVPEDDVRLTMCA